MPAGPTTAWRRRNAKTSWLALAATFAFHTRDRFILNGGFEQQPLTASSGPVHVSYPARLVTTWFQRRAGGSPGFQKQHSELQKGDASTGHDATFTPRCPFHCLQLEGEQGGGGGG